MNVKKLQEDYDFEDDINNNSDQELEVIYEENEEDIVEDATVEDIEFFQNYNNKTLDIKSELKRSVLKVSNLKQTLKTTIKDSIISLNQSTLERDCEDSYNQQFSAFSSTDNDIFEEDSDEIEQMEESITFMHDENENMDEITDQKVL